MPQFDVFLSHNSVDKPWVITLKENLWRYGVSVWLDKDEIRPGNLFAEDLERGLADSHAMALIVSPEAMASGWVKEEYYRALSLTKDKRSPTQLIPVILRDAEVPGFIKSRNWVDFRDESIYAHNVWKLVWGITGQKPPQVLDLTGPPPTTAVAPRPQTRPLDVQAVSSAPQPAASPRTGGIKAGGKIQAENIVTGVQMQGGDAELARAALELAKNIQSGGIEAVGDIIAKNLVTGFQYLGQGGSSPTLEQFHQELAALREQLAQAIAAGEFDDDYAAEDVQTAIARAAEQAATAAKITGQLDQAGKILTKAGETALAAGKFGATIIKLAPLVAGLKHLVEQIL